MKPCEITANPVKALIVVQDHIVVYFSHHRLNQYLAERYLPRLPIPELPHKRINTTVLYVACR
jgi:hypothetical protein